MRVACSPGSVSVSEIRALRTALSQSQHVASKHSSLVTLALAAESALEGSAAEHWSAMAKQEQQLVALCTEGLCLECS